MIRASPKYDLYSTHILQVFFFCFNPKFILILKCNFKRHENQFMLIKKIVENSIVKFRFKFIKAQ